MDVEDVEEDDVPSRKCRSAPSSPIMRDHEPDMENVSRNRLLTDLKECSVPRARGSSTTLFTTKAGKENLDIAEVASVASTQVPASRNRLNSDATESLSGSWVQSPPTSFTSSSPTQISSLAWTTPDDVDLSEQSNHRTTLMFRNLPTSFTRAQLEELLASEGFGTRYDFIYLPAELTTRSCFGYAFINMMTADDAERFLQHFQGFDRWPVPDDRRAVVHLSEALQGLDEQIERYRNSPLMHNSVPDELRPAVYSNGQRIPFPEPTAPVRPPRVRTSAKKKVPPPS